MAVPGWLRHCRCVLCAMMRTGGVFSGRPAKIERAATNRAGVCEQEQQWHLELLGSGRPVE